METNRHNGRGRLDTVLKYAKKHGYEDIKYRYERNDYKIYEMVMGKNQTYIGLPRFLIVSKKSFRTSSDDETFSILDYLNEVEK